MSLSYVPLEPIRVQDPIQNVNSVHKYAVMEGGSQISYKPYTSTSVNSSSMQFSCPTPSGNVIIDRDVSITVPIRLTFTGLIKTTDLGLVTPTSLLNDGLDAPRAMPFSSALDTLQVGINNDSVSVNLADIVHTLTKFNLDTELANQEYSMSPNYPDQSFDYQSLVGSNRSPLASWGDSTLGAKIPRGGFSFKIISNATVVPTLLGTPATAIVDMMVTENILLSPFFTGKAKDDCQGFYNVNSMDFNFNILTQAGMRMWSHASVVSTSGVQQITSNISAISAQFNNFTGAAFDYPVTQPTILFKYITPNQLDRQILGQNVPITYPYFEIQRYPTDIGSSIVYGTPQTVSSNNIQLSSIPKRMYVVGRLANSVLQSSPNYTDCFLAVQNVSVQFANQQNSLSNASQAQLYKINVENGYKHSWNEFSGLPVQNSAFAPEVGNSPYGTTAGPLCLEFGKDIPIGDDQAPGMIGQFQIQVNAQLANMNASGAWNNLKQTLYLIMVFEGTFTITSLGSAQHQIGVVSHMDVLNARKLPAMNYRAVGGDFWTSLGNFATKAHDWLKQNQVISKGAKLLGTVGVPYASTIGDVASTLGYGRGGLSIGGTAIVESHAGVGGMRMTKAQIRKRL